MEWFDVIILNKLLCDFQQPRMNFPGSKIAFMQCHLTLGSSKRSYLGMEGGAISHSMLRYTPEAILVAFITVFVRFWLYKPFQDH